MYMYISYIDSFSILLECTASGTWHRGARAQDGHSLMAKGGELIIPKYFGK